MEPKRDEATKTGSQRGTRAWVAHESISGKWLGSLREDITVGGSLITCLLQIGIIAYETDFHKRGFAPRDYGCRQNRPNIDLEVPGSRAHPCFDAQPGW